MEIPFREQVKARMAEAFGEPVAVPLESGPLYRWVLKRADGHAMHLYITLDSPENPNIGHVLISDPSSHAVEPVQSATVRTIEELERVIAAIVEQWKRQP